MKNIGDSACSSGDDDDIIVAEVIRAVHEDAPALDPRIVVAIDVLCAQAALARAICDRYRHDGTAAEGAAPLGPGELENLLAALLHVAVLHESPDRGVRGLALKSLNAVFTLLPETRPSSPALSRAGELRKAACALAALVR